MTTWTIDPAHSNLGFTVRHLVISKVRGEFGRWSGTYVMGDGADPLEGASLSGSVDIASIDTRQADRDAHLRSPDFFDVDRFPTATFQSTLFVKVDETRFKVHGDLTLHGITREIVLDGEFLGIATDPWGNVKAGFTVETTLNRFDFGMQMSAVIETGGLVVGDKVKIEIGAELLKTT